MKCNNCHANIPNDSLFCPFCGKKVETSSASGQRSVSDSNYHELQVAFSSDLVDVAKAYNGLMSEQKARFFPGQQFQAKKVIHSFLYLLGQDCDYSRLLELYITIVSRVMMGFDTERIAITVKARFSGILTENKTATLIECAKRINSNYDFLSKVNTPEYIVFEKQFDQQYTNSLTENEKHINDAVKLPDYGTSTKNPIYTHSAAGSYKYLNLLYTSDLVPLTWNRAQSVAVNNMKDPLDQYALLLPDGTQIKTVYVNMYSRSNPHYCPEGLFGFGLKEIGGETATQLQPPAKEQRSTPKTREENNKQGGGEKTEEQRENNKGKKEKKVLADTTPVLSEELFSENTTSVLQGNLPVLLVKKAIRKRSDGQVSAVCIFQPVTKMPIRAMQVDVLCYDVWHEQVQSVERFQYNDLRTTRAASFGADTVIPLPDPNTREIEVVVQRIMLADGTLIQREEDNLALPDVAAIGEYLADVNLVREYKEKTIETAKYVPVKAGHYWRCTCGAINLEEEAICHRCKASVLTLFKYLDKNALQSSIDEKKRLLREKEERERIAREKEEEQKRIEREKEEERRRERSRIEAAEAYAREEERRRKSKKRVRICAVIGSFAFAAYLVWSLIIPAIQYKKADELLSAGDRDAAYTTFMGITRYGDSYNRACAIRYEDARAAFTAGDYDKAYDLFTSISNFSDSATRAKDAVYQKAKVLMEAGEYTEAALLYESLSGYLDSKARGTECRNEQTFIDATTQFEMGHYKKAGELFESLKTYKDSSSLMMQSYYYYAKNLIESGDLHSGYVILSTKVNQGDSSYEDSIELANAAEYQYAADCFKEGRYAAAAESFANLTDYKDSATRCQEAKYQYGLSLIGDGKYDEAITTFEQISNYRDSANQLKEAKYQKALLLMHRKFMSQEKYQEAERLFEELGYYRDSTTQLKECKYQRAIMLAKSEKYTQAVPLFKEIGNYSDSVEQWKGAMWSYILKHKNNDDKTTYEYLTELRKYNYKDSKQYYEELYTWKITGYVNTSVSDTTTELPLVSSYTKNVTFHYKLNGGAPGETITLYHSVTWPDGSYAKQTYTWDNLKDGDTFTSRWDGYFWDDPAYGRAGVLSSTIYDQATGRKIGTVSIRVTD